MAIGCPEAKPICRDEKGTLVPQDESLSSSTGRSAPLVRRVAYKAGEKVHVTDIPAGPVMIKVDMLDKDNKSLFVGTGHTQVQKGDRAAAIVYVSPTAGKGGINIRIQGPASGPFSCE